MATAPPMEDTETSPSPPIFDIALLDTHLSSLSATLSFLTHSLGALDAGAQDPARETGTVVEEVDADWLARELITLKGMAGMLCDGLGRVRRKVVGRGNANGGKGVGCGKRRRDGEGVEGIEDGEGGEGGGRETKRRGERLSIEGARPTVPSGTSEDAAPAAGDDVDGGNDVRDDGAYQVAYIDVTEEVNRRLALTRLRQLSAVPRTSVKRKWSDVLSSPQDVGGNGAESDGRRANEGKVEDKGGQEEREAEGEGDGDVEGEKGRRKRVKFSSALERFQSRETSSPVRQSPTPTPGRASATESSSNDINGEGSSRPNATANGGGAGVKRLFRASLDGSNEVGEALEGQVNGGNSSSAGRSAGTKRRKI